MSAKVWRKAKESNDTNCVEVNNQLKRPIGVRDSKNPDKELHFDNTGWTAFLKAAQTGDFTS
jgi:hypothetical protein